MPISGVGERPAVPVSCHLPVLALLYYIQFVVPLLESLSFPFTPQLEIISFSSNFLSTHGVCITLWSMISYNLHILEHLLLLIFLSLPTIVSQPQQVINKYLLNEEWQREKTYLSIRSMLRGKRSFHLFLVRNQIYYISSFINKGFQSQLIFSNNDKRVFFYESPCHANRMITHTP